MNLVRNICRCFCPALIAAALLCACSETPDGVIPPKKMAQIVADLELGDAVVASEPNRWNNDSLKRHFRQSILMAHGVTSEQLDTSYYWYGHHMDLYTEVYDKAIEILEQRADEARRAGTAVSLAQASENTLSQDGDSVDVWNSSKVRRLSALSPSQIISFNINRDRNWETGDIFELRFKASPARNNFNISMGADYTGSVTPDHLAIKRHNNGGWITVKFPLDSAARPTRIFGAIGYEPHPGEVVWIDSLSILRIHRKNR